MLPAMKDAATARGTAPAITLPGRGSLADELFAYLRDAIVRGELAPGARVVEGEIAARARVSRTPVGQALRRLQSADLLRASRHGLVVNELSADELAEACVVRDALEALAARLAAATRTDLDLALLEELTERFARAVGEARTGAAEGAEVAEAAEVAEVAEIVALNHAFHEAVWDAARNTFLRRQLHQTRCLIERLDSTTLATGERQRQALAEHRSILAAIRERDADRAESTTLEHFRRATAIRLLSKRAATRRVP